MQNEKANQMLRKLAELRAMFEAPFLEKVMHYSDEVEEYMDKLDAPSHRLMNIDFNTNTITVQGEPKPFVNLDPKIVTMFYILYEFYLHLLKLGYKKPKPILSEELLKCISEFDDDRNIMHRRTFERKLKKLKETFPELRKCIVVSKGPGGGYSLNLSRGQPG